MKHLWEADHSYYCNVGNYFNNDCVDQHESWADFVEGGGTSADPDYNLVFRWDWDVPDPADYGDGEELPSDRLQVCWMTQRKGYYRTSLVNVTPNDEPAVRAWLKGRLAHLLALWAPLS